MYEDYYNKIPESSMNPDNKKGIHVKTFNAKTPYDRDKKTQEFLNEMTEYHGGNFQIISISNPMTMRGFSTQVTYNIS